MEQSDGLTEHHAKTSHSPAASPLLALRPVGSRPHGQRAADGSAGGVVRLRRIRCRLERLFSRLGELGRRVDLRQVPDSPGRLATRHPFQPVATRLRGKRQGNPCRSATGSRRVGRVHFSFGTGHRGGGLERRAPAMELCDGRSARRERSGSSRDRNRDGLHPRRPVRPGRW